MAASRENDQRYSASILGDRIELDFGTRGPSFFSTKIVLRYIYQINPGNTQKINSIVDMVIDSEVKKKLIEDIRLHGIPYSLQKVTDEMKGIICEELTSLNVSHTASNITKITELPYTSSIRMPGSSNVSYPYEEMKSRNEIESLRASIKKIPIDANKDVAIRASAPQIQSNLIAALDGYVQSLEPHPTISKLCAKNPAHKLLRMISTCYRLAYDFAHDWRMVAFLVLDKLFSDGGKAIRANVPIDKMLHAEINMAFPGKDQERKRTKLKKYVDNCHASLQDTRAGESTSEERCRTAMLGLNRELVILSNDPSVVGEDITPWLYDDFKDTLLMTIREDTPNPQFDAFLDANIWGVYNESCNLGKDDLIRILHLPEGKSATETKNTLSLLKALKPRTPIRFWEDQYDAANTALLSETVMIDRQDFTHEPVNILGSQIQAFPAGTLKASVKASFSGLSGPILDRIQKEGGLVSEYKGCIGIILGKPTELSVNRIAATLGDKCQRSGASAENLECLSIEWVGNYNEENERAILCLLKTWTDEIQRIYLMKFQEKIRALELESRIEKGRYNGVLQITLDTLFQYALHVDGAFPYMAFSGLDKERNPCLFLRCFDKTALKMQQQEDFNARLLSLSALIDQHTYFLQTANALLTERQELCNIISKHTAYPELCLASAMLASNIPAYKQKAEIEREKYKNLSEFLKRDKSYQATLHGAILDSPKTIEEAIERAICVKDMLDDFDDGLARIHATFRDLNTFDDRQMQNISIDKSVGLQLLKKHLDVVAHVRDAGVYKNESEIQICAIAAMAMHYEGEGQSAVDGMIKRLLYLQDNMLNIKSLGAYEKTYPISHFKHVRFGYSLLQGYFITDPKKPNSEYPKRILECISKSKSNPVLTLPEKLKYDADEYEATFNFLCNKDPEFSKMMKVSASLLFLLINMREGRGNPLLLYSKILAQETNNNSKSKKQKGRSEEKMNNDKIEKFTSWYEQLHPEHGKTYMPSMVVSFTSFADNCMTIEVLSNAWNNHAASSSAMNVSSSSINAVSPAIAFESVGLESQVEAHSLSPRKPVGNPIPRRQILTGRRTANGATTSSTTPNTNITNPNPSSKKRKGGGTKKRKSQTHKRQPRKRKTVRKALKTRKN